MFLFHQPSPHDVERFIAASRELPLSYDPIGLAREGGRGFNVDEQIEIVGRGEAAFARATTALSEWRHFELGWVELFPKRASIEPGTVVVVSARHLGFWSLNGCRVVYSIGTRNHQTFGFAYGTLANHAETGEEIFQVSFRPETREVSYLIRAASKPRAALAKLGFPLARLLQARFRRDSARALRRYIDG
jgi:uncharacterized protein (UPF0548 family)